MEHSPIGASAAYRWTKCPGSIALIATCPPALESPYALEGTAAHEIAQVCLNLGTSPFKYIGQALSHGVKCTEEMAEAVQVYLDIVREDLKKAGKAKLWAEKGFDLSKDVYPGLRGTNDAAIAVEFGKLIIYDYKHGAGVPVEVKDNPQLLYYGRGGLCIGDYDPVEIVIVQPRAPHKDGPVRRFTYSQEEVLAFGDYLKEKAEATKQKNAPLVAGDHCKFCPALSKCPAVLKQIQEVAQADFSKPVPVLPDPTQLSTLDITKVLSIMGLIDDWVKAVEEQAEERAKRGEKIPGFKLVKKRSNRAWISEDEVKRTFEDSYGEAIFAPRKLLTPAQMEKKVGKGNAIVVDTLCHNPDTGTCLVPEADPRPAVNPALDFQ